MRPPLPVSLALLVLLIATTAAGCSPGPRGSSTSFSTVILPKPTDSTIITQPAQITGIWQVYSTHCTPGYMIIRDNGTYVWSCRVDGSDGVSGKYHFSDGAFVLLNDICGTEGRYRVNGSDPAGPRTLTFSVVKDSCGLEIQALTAQKATWVADLP